MCTISLFLAKFGPDCAEIHPKVCAKSIGAHCKIFKYLNRFTFNGWIFSCYGFLLSCR